MQHGKFGHHSHVISIGFFRVLGSTYLRPGIPLFHIVSTSGTPSSLQSRIQHDGNATSIMVLYLPNLWSMLLEFGAWEAHLNHLPVACTVHATK